MANLAIRKKVVSQNHFPPPPTLFFVFLKKFQQGGVHVCHFANFHPREQKWLNLEQFLAMEINSIFLNGNFASYKNFEVKPILTKIILEQVQLFVKCQISSKWKMKKLSKIKIFRK